MISGSSRHPVLLNSMRELKIFSAALLNSFNPTCVGFTKKFLKTILFAGCNFILSPMETESRNLTT